MVLTAAKSALVSTGRHASTRVDSGAGGARAPAQMRGGAAYGRMVNPADLQGLRSGDLETREEHLYQLLDRARSHDDESAIAALHVLVRDYRDFTGPCTPGR